MLRPLTQRLVDVMSGRYQYAELSNWLFWRFIVCIAYIHIIYAVYLFLCFILFMLVDMFICFFLTLYFFLFVTQTWGHVHTFSYTEWYTGWYRWYSPVIFPLTLCNLKMKVIRSKLYMSFIIFAHWFRVGGSLRSQHLVIDFFTCCHEDF